MASERRAVIFRGGATTSAREARGHGIWFEHKAVAGLAGTFPGNPYVVNHENDVRSVAGYITKAGVKRPTIEVDLVEFKEGKDGRLERKVTGKRKERAAVLTYEALLTEDQPGFDAVMKHVEATQAAGRVPHNSIAVIGSGLHYEVETDRLFLTGPLEAIHLGHVLVGAFQPTEHVGVFEVEELDPEVAASLPDTGPLLVEPITMGGAACVGADVLIVNAEELLAAFSIDAPPHLVQRASIALGIETRPKKKPKPGRPYGTTFQVIAVDGEPVGSLTIDGDETTDDNIPAGSNTRLEPATLRSVEVEAETAAALQAKVDVQDKALAKQGEALAAATKRLDEVALALTKASEGIESLAGHQASQVEAAQKATLEQTCVRILAEFPGRVTAEAIAKLDASGLAGLEVGLRASAPSNRLGSFPGRTAAGQAAEDGLRISDGIVIAEPEKFRKEQEVFLASLQKFSVVSPGGGA